MRCVTEDDELNLKGLYQRQLRMRIGDDVLAAGMKQPLQNLLSASEDSLDWTYPLPKAETGSSLSLSSSVTKALADVSALEDDVLDVTAAAHQMALHVLKLLQDPM